MTLDGPAKLSFTEDVGKRYESWGWQVLHVKDGNTDLAALDAAIAAAKAETGKPSLIIVKTTIGYGSPNKSGKSSSHGSPLGDDEIALTKKALGWTYPEKFFIPDGGAGPLPPGGGEGRRRPRPTGASASRPTAWRTRRWRRSSSG